MSHSDCTALLCSAVTHPNPPPHCSMFRRMLYGDSGSKKKKKPSGLKPSDGYIEKYDFKGQVTVIVKDFESEVFKQLVEFIHTGSVILQARTLLGLMNAANHYGLEDLKMACIHFMERCVTTDTVCSLLTSAEKYIQYKSTKILVQKMFEFVDLNAETILGLGAFSMLPQHVVRIVLGREELHATETSKFEAALRWCVRYCEEHQELSLKQAFEPFVDVIQFYRIPAKHLMKSVKPVQVVDDGIILNALAFQADPKSVEHLQQHQRPRKSTMEFPLVTSVPRRFRRVQSSGKVLANQNGSDVVAPASNSNRSRGSSVPPVGTHIPERRDRMLSSRGEVHSLKVLDTRSESAESRTSLSTASLNSPKSPSIDSYQESFSSQGEVDSETPLQQAIMQPVSIEQTSKQPTSVAQASMQPASIEQASMQPVSVEQASMQPASVEQASMQPASVEKASMQPVSVEQAREINMQQVSTQRKLPCSALDAIVTLSSKVVEV